MPLRTLLALLTAVLLIVGCDSNPQAPTAPRPGEPAATPPAAKESKKGTSKGAASIPFN